MIRHRILIALLALGTVGGYAAGFASLHHHHRHFARCCDHDDRERGAWRDDRDHERGSWRDDHERGPWRDDRGYDERGGDPPR
jgi:hypothetical protein